MKTILTVFLLLLIYSFSYPQVGLPEEESKGLEKSVYGIGLSSGWTSGFGLSFRHHPSGNFSYQLIGGILKVDKDIAYNFGTEGHYDFVRGQSTRFYGAGALGYFYVGENENKLDGPFRYGLGIGGEFSTMEQLNFTIELLFTSFSNGDIMPLPQASIHYYFF